jgi:hypothetical protein
MGLRNALSDDHDEVPARGVVRQGAGGNDDTLSPVAPQEDQTAVFRNLAESAP